MDYKDPKTLTKWNLNPKEQTKGEYERMLENYKEYGQLTNFLVMPDGVILGGNHGLDAVTELGLQARCNNVDFVQEGDEWFFVNEGDIKRQKSYKSKEEGMLRVSIAHNQRFSHYDASELANISGNYQVDLSDISFDFAEQQLLGDLGAIEPNTDAADLPEVKMKLSITFKTKEDFDNAKIEIQQILEKYAGAELK